MCRARSILLAAVLGIVGLLTLPGCHQDMLRATPFGSSIHDKSTSPAEDRIALWPLFYHRSPATSFLWPLGELTDDSWAFRPLVAVYDDSKKLDFLWPFIHINRNQDSGYFFPLVFWRADERWHYWTPVLGQGKSSADGGWFYSPLYMTWWGSDARTHLALPLLTTWGHVEEERSWFGSPLYVQLRNKEGTERFIPPLLTGWATSTDAASAWFGSPPYVQMRHGDASQVIFPFLLTGWADSPEKSTFLSPLYGRFRTDKETRSFVSPLLSWWTRTEDEGWSLDLLLSFFGMTRAPDRSSEHVFPLYWRGWQKVKLDPTEEGERRWFALMPFYMGIDGERGQKFRALPFLLSARTVSEAGDPGWHLLLSMVGWGSRKHLEGEDRGDSYLAFHHVFPLYYYNHRPKSTRFGLPFLLYGQKVRDDGSWRARFLFFLAGLSGSDTRSAAFFHPLFSYSHRRPHLEDKPPPLKVQRQSIAQVDGQQQKQGVRLVDEVRFDFLLYLFDTRTQEYEDDSTYRRTRILWRVYHDEAHKHEETNEDSRSIDIFPFITYDRAGSESLTWSWLYKFIRYERRGAAKAFNLFFLPAIRWGEDPEG